MDFYRLYRIICKEAALHTIYPRVTLGQNKFTVTKYVAIEGLKFINVFIINPSTIMFAEYMACNVFNRCRFQSFKFR